MDMAVWQCRTDQDWLRLRPFITITIDIAILKLNLNLNLSLPRGTPT